MSSLLHNELVNDCPDSKEAVLITVAKLKLLSEDVSKVSYLIRSVIFSPYFIEVPSLTPSNH